MHIAVAFCTHEGERFIGEQLESVAVQSRPPDEVVVGDDCSTDGTVDALSRFAAAAPFPVRVLGSAERLGTARNFDRVIAACDAGTDAGDAIIVLADQDDVWHPDKLAAIEDAFASGSRPGLVFSNGDLIDARSEPIAGSCWDLVRLSAEEAVRLEGSDGFATLLNRQLAFGGTVTGATMALRTEHRSLVLPLPDWLPTWGKAAMIHDAWIALLVAAVAPVRALPRRLVHYRIHPDQQVGLVAHPPVSRLRMARVALRSLGRADRNGARMKEAEAQWLRALLGRLAAATAAPAGSPPGRAAESRRLLEGHVAHFEARADLPARRLRRVRPIAAELASGRYRRYSQGSLSAARDLLEP